LKTKWEFPTTSDSYLLGPLFFDHGVNMFNLLSGMFATIIYDAERKTFIAARDHVGIIPCYYGTGKEGEIYITNELKSFSDVAVSINILLPGQYISNDLKPVQWYFPEWHDIEYIPTNKVDLTVLRNNLIQSV